MTISTSTSFKTDAQGSFESSSTSKKVIIDDVMEDTSGADIATLSTLLPLPIEHDEKDSNVVVGAVVAVVAIVETPTVTVVVDEVLPSSAPSTSSVPFKTDSSDNKTSSPSSPSSTPATKMQDFSYADVYEEEKDDMKKNQDDESDYTMFLTFDEAVEDEVIASSSDSISSSSSSSHSHLKDITPEMINLCVHKVEKLLLHDRNNELLWRLEALLEKKKKLNSEVADKVAIRKSSPKTLRVAREFIVKAQKSSSMGLTGEAIRNLEKAAALLPKEKQDAIRFKIEKMKKTM
eukprot:TRINITY_DN3921_c0_g1_i2.p1 TRINITY_DN3921_c0_g1~~TRINITY_DN3921_c0_g1_i2.p1  ORF type:complete len:291 (-),score=113.85 TRINITY_DN3921_c0_g1_i2:78-950(-)